MQYTLKKSLGQHFLKDENICRQIVEAIVEEKPKQLVEVGPGGGALTKYLLQLKDIDFKAVELDKEKVDYLEQTYPAIKGKLLHEDFLNADVPFEGHFMLVGNFPYNISSQILFKVLDWKEQVDSVVGMFQKEVAQRIASKEGNKSYGILSVLIQAYFDVEYLFDVDENCFTPPPKVKSGVIKLTPVKEIPAMQSEKKFKLLVKTAFNQRRKMLRNGVRGMFDEEFIKEDIFNKRAEQLTVKQFAELTFKMR
ncbi:MAG: ribosomal RNA small subunit methyltransferase A [Chitinophagaceae bacterium]|nr:ribosomal RNA small subunit methyltransferase A [Chitinophagaceae bacterium]